MQREYRDFLDMLGFNKRFVKDFCKISKPLYGLLNKDVMFNFKDVCLNVFNLLKQKLITELMCEASSFVKMMLCLNLIMRFCMHLTH